MVAAIRSPNSRAMRPNPLAGWTTHAMASKPGPMVSGASNIRSATMARPAREAPPISTRATK